MPQNRKALVIGNLFGFGLGMGLGMGLGLSFVWYLGRKKSNMPVALDQFNLTQLSGNWFELARLDSAGGPDLMDCRIEVSQLPQTNGQLRLVSHYRLGRLDAPLESCEKRLQPTGAAGRFKLGKQPVWILELSAEADYVLAGTPDRRHLWLLARVPELPTERWKQISERIQAQGFAVEQLVRTPLLA